MSIQEFDLEDEELDEIAETIEKSPAGKPRRIGRWTMFGLIFLSALATIFYVWNVIRTDTLLSDIQELKSKHRELSNENMVLASKLNRLQAPERIIQLAKDKLGMVRSAIPPEKLP